MPIFFYRVNEDYGCFSNFAAYPIELDKLKWPTTEHYFQAQKFIRTAPEHAMRIQSTSSPMEAANMGRSRDYPMRSDWEDVKVSIMKKAVRVKFQTYPELQQILLATGDEEILEKTNVDHFWGIGSRVMVRIC
ncbi:NADAR family protein [Risungbinella massiliensis]|uniref:NADAR family protein n=1 Tax=Risungbinella massiliensis TaxID=1329796 RepID=UPI000A5C8AB8|nr:NADAR family protein [Risungbinella massiliensis]